MHSYPPSSSSLYVATWQLTTQLVQTILDQTHLSPLPPSTRPTLWEYDHALRLYPMPTAIVLADKFERYELTYEGCHVFNPGRFVCGGGAAAVPVAGSTQAGRGIDSQGQALREGGEFEWAMYYPATGRSERRSVSLQLDHWLLECKLNKQCFIVRFIADLYVGRHQRASWSYQLHH